MVVVKAKHMSPKILKSLISTHACFTYDADNYYLYNSPNDAGYVEQLRLTNLIAQELDKLKRQKRMPKLGYQ